MAEVKPTEGDEVFEAGSTTAYGTIVDVHHQSRRGPKDTGDLSYFVSLIGTPEGKPGQAHVIHSGTRFEVL
jgi:hypothetical protein